MTKQEFEILVGNANLVRQSDELFDAVNNALISLDILGDYDGDDNDKD